MAASEVTSSLVVFTASIAITASALAFFGLAVQDVARSAESAGRELALQMRTSIQIINDPASVPGSAPKVYVKNTGTHILHPNGTTLLVDGVVRTSAAFEVLNASHAGQWRPGEVLQVQDATLTLPAGDHSFLVIVDRGVRDRLEVNV